MHALEPSIAFTQQYKIMNHLIKEVDFKKYFKHFHNSKNIVAYTPKQCGIAYYIGGM